MGHEPLQPQSRATAIAAWIGAAALIAMVWVVALSFIAFDRSQTIEAAVRENQNRAIAFEQYVTRTLETANVAAVHIASRMAGELARAKGERPQPLTDPIASNALFAAVMLTDAQGKVQFSTVPGAPPLDLGASRGLALLRSGEAEGPLVSRPLVSHSLRQPVFSITRPVRDPNGRFVGTVIVQTPIGQLTAFNEGARIRPLDLISVIRLDGRTLARRTGSRISYGEDLRGKLVMQHQLADPNGTYLGPSALDGRMRWFSHRRLRNFPIFVTVGVGEADVLAPVREHRRWALAAAAALTAAIAALALLISIGARRRDKAAEELREANRRFDTAQRIARIGDWTYDPATGLVSGSAAMCEMYGLPTDGTPFPLDQGLTCFDEADRERMRRMMESAIATGRCQQCECVARTGPAAPSARRVVCTPVKDADGRVTMLSGTDQDISQERITARLREEVAHIGRVESMNLMAATLAHELAQPLTAAANYLMVARIQRGEGEGGESAGEDAIHKAERQVGLAQEIIRGARDMLSRRAGETEAAPVAAVVQDAVHLVRVTNRHCGVEIDMPNVNGLCVAANKVQVQQVLMNLVRNAVEAVCELPQPRVAIRAEAEAETVLFRVEDNGPGFPSEADALFTPFAADSRSGLGLGLSISRTIVETYGGSIWIERDGGDGSAVCFRLPRLRDQALD